MIIKLKKKLDFHQSYIIKLKILSLLNIRVLFILLDNNLIRNFKLFKNQLIMKMIFIFQLYPKMENT